MKLNHISRPFELVQKAVVFVLTFALAFPPQSFAARPAALMDRPDGQQSFADLASSSAGTVLPAATSSELRQWTSVSIPSDFAGWLKRFDVQVDSIQATSLRRYHQDSYPVPPNLFEEAQSALAVVTSIAQAFGSFLYAGGGKSIKTPADNNAVFMGDQNIRYYTATHPNEAVVVFGDEGDWDESASLQRGSIYYRGALIAYQGISNLRRHIKNLRKENAHVKFMFGDGLENTNGTASPEASTGPTNSTSLVAFFDEDKEPARLLNDDMRVLAISFSAPSHGGVSAFDLPSKALPKIAASRGIEHGLTYSDFTNSFIILMTGPREIKKVTDEEVHRHQRFIDDVRELQRRYPGLKLLLPGDGDLVPRIIASAGIDLDGRSMGVFGRSGAIELTASKIAVFNTPNGQIADSFVSPTATNRDVAIGKEGSHQYNNEELEAFRGLEIPREVYASERNRSHVLSGGILALTSTTGASPDFFGPTFADLFQRITIRDSEGKIIEPSDYPKAQGRGTLTTNTLFMSRNGGVFVLRTTFSASDLAKTLPALKSASTVSALSDTEMRLGLSGSSAQLKVGSSELRSVDQYLDQVKAVQQKMTELGIRTSLTPGEVWSLLQFVPASGKAIWLAFDQSSVKNWVQLPDAYPTDVRSSIYPDQATGDIWYRLILSAHLRDEAQKRGERLGFLFPRTLIQHPLFQQMLRGEFPDSLKPYLPAYVSLRNVPFLAQGEDTAAPRYLRAKQAMTVRESIEAGAGGYKTNTFFWVPVEGKVNGKARKYHARWKRLIDENLEWTKERAQEIKEVTRGLGYGYIAEVLVYSAPPRNYVPYRAEKTKPATFEKVVKKLQESGYSLPELAAELAKDEPADWAVDAQFTGWLDSDEKKRTESTVAFAEAHERMTKRAVETLMKIPGLTIVKTSGPYFVGTQDEWDQREPKIKAGMQQLKKWADGKAIELTRDRPGDVFKREFALGMESGAMVGGLVGRAGFKPTTFKDPEAKADRFHRLGTPEFNHGIVKSREYFGDVFGILANGTASIWRSYGITQEQAEALIAAASELRSVKVERLNWTFSDEPNASQPSHRMDERLIGFIKDKMGRPGLTFQGFGFVTGSDSRFYELKPGQDLEAAFKDAFRQETAQTKHAFDLYWVEDDVSASAALAFVSLTKPPSDPSIPNLLKALFVGLFRADPMAQAIATGNTLDIFGGRTRSRGRSAELRSEKLYQVWLQNNDPEIIARGAEALAKTANTKLFETATVEALIQALKRTSAQAAAHGRDSGKYIGYSKYDYDNSLFQSIADNAKQALVLNAKKQLESNFPAYIVEQLGTKLRLPFLGIDGNTLDARTPITNHDVDLLTVIAIIEVIKEIGPRVQRFPKVQGRLESFAGLRLAVTKESHLLFHRLAQAAFDALVAIESASSSAELRKTNTEFLADQGWNTISLDFLDSTADQVVDFGLANGATDFTTNPFSIGTSVVKKTDPKLIELLKQAPVGLKGRDLLKWIYWRRGAQIAERLRPVFEQSQGKKGFVSVEVEPAFAYLWEVQTDGKSVSPVTNAQGRIVIRKELQSVLGGDGASVEALKIRLAGDRALQTDVRDALVNAILEEVKQIAAFAPNIAVKIGNTRSLKPFLGEELALSVGLTVLERAAALGITTNFTLIFGLRDGQANQNAYRRGRVQANQAGLIHPGRPVRGNNSYFVSRVEPWTLANVPQQVLDYGQGLIGLLTTAEAYLRDFSEPVTNDPSVDKDQDLIVASLTNKLPGPADLYVNAFVGGGFRAKLTIAPETIESFNRKERGEIVPLLQQARDIYLKGDKTEQALRSALVHLVEPLFRDQSRLTPLYNKEYLQELQSGAILPKEAAARAVDEHFRFQQDPLHEKMLDALSEDGDKKFAIPFLQAAENVGKVSAELRRETTGVLVEPSGAVQVTPLRPEVSRQVQATLAELRNVLQNGAADDLTARIGMVSTSTEEGLIVDGTLFTSELRDMDDSELVIASALRLTYPHHPMAVLISPARAGDEASLAQYRAELRMFGEVNLYLENQGLKPIGLQTSVDQAIVSLQKQGANVIRALVGTTSSFADAIRRRIPDALIVTQKRFMDFVSRHPYLGQIMAEIRNYYAIARAA